MSMLSTARSTSSNAKLSWSSDAIEAFNTSKSSFPQLLYCTTLSQMLRLPLQLTPLTSQLEEYYNSGLTAFGSRSPSSIRNSATGSASIQPSAKNSWLFTLHSSNSVIMLKARLFIFWRITNLFFVPYTRKQHEKYQEKNVGWISSAYIRMILDTIVATQHCGWRPLPSSGQHRRNDNEPRSIGGIDFLPGRRPRRAPFTSNGWHRTKTIIL